MNLIDINLMLCVASLPIRPLERFENTCVCNDNGRDVQILKLLENPGN